MFYPWRSYNNGVTRTAANTAGGAGVVHQLSAGGAPYRIDVEGGAQDTQRALRLVMREKVGGCGHSRLRLRPLLGTPGVFLAAPPADLPLSYAPAVGYH